MAKLKNEGMKELSECMIFPRDLDTLWIIREAESCFVLDSKDIDKMTNTELIEYIDQLALILLKY